MPILVEVTYFLLKVSYNFFIIIMNPQIIEFIFSDVKTNTTPAKTVTYVTQSALYSIYASSAKT